jgi:hypothetical protein
MDDACTFALEEDVDYDDQPVFTIVAMVGNTTIRVDLDEDSLSRDILALDLAAGRFSGTASEGEFCIKWDDFNVDILVGSTWRGTVTITIPRRGSSFSDTMTEWRRRVLLWHLDDALTPLRA